MGKHIKDVLYEQIRGLKRANPNMGRGTIAKALACTERKVRTAFQRMKIEEHNATPLGQPGKTMSIKKPGDEIELDYSSNKAVITTKSLNIQTVEDALRVSKVDMDLWEVQRFIVNSWEVTMGAKQTTSGTSETYTNYQVKLWLQKKSEEEVSTESILSRVDEIALPYGKVNREKITDPHMLEIGLYDHHFGMYAWADDCGGENYDIKIAEDFFLRACKSLLNRVQGFEIEKIIFPIGNDFFHSNDRTNLTPGHKNPLDADGRFAKVFEAGKMAVIKAIRMCREVAPVEIIWVTGNHDLDSSYSLCQVLWGMFYNDPEVTVDIGASSRKHRVYGINFIGLTHGCDEKWADLPRVFMDEWTQDWADTKYREIHVGHQHKKKKTDFLSMDSFGSTAVRMLPSLCTTDAWHYNKGFISKDKAAESFLWNADKGLVGTFLTHIDLE